MRQRLTENIIVKASAYHKIERPLTESEQTLLVEGTPYKALAIYRFEFTRPGQKNLNGRIYPYALWDKVLAAGLVTLALMDHPAEGAGNPKDVWAVVRNPQYSEDRSVITADAYIIDNENGRSALGVLEAGGDLGLSSSGYGDFLSDGITVDPDTFQLERYFDWVLQPSYEVYGHQQDKIGEAATAIANHKTENKEISMKTMTLREKRDYEISMKKIFAETSAIANPKERLAKAKEALSFYEGIDCDTLKKEFEELAANAEKECDAAIAKAQEADAALQRAENAELDAGTAKAENAAKDKIISSLEQELNAKKEEVDKKDASIKEYKELIKSFTEDASKKVSYDDYCKLREFAERAVHLLSEKRSEIGRLQAENLSLRDKLNLSERRLTALVNKQMKEEAAAKEHQKKVLEARQNTERKIQESKERELVENANPEVRSYYEDLVARGEDVAHMREAILHKKTLFEAQTFFLKNKHHKTFEEQKFANTDLSVQIAGGRGTQVNTEINLPKGFI